MEHFKSSTTEKIDKPIHKTITHDIDTNPCENIFDKSSETNGPIYANNIGSFNFEKLN